MNIFTRGIRNTFRNLIRTFSVVFILGLSIGLSLIMLISRSAVNDKINQTKSSIGNSVSIRPAGINGFEGGGNLLTTDQLKPVSSLPHVTSITETLNDRLTSTNTSLQSSITAGSFGQRQANINNQSNTPGGNGGGRFGANFDPANFKPPVTLTGINNTSNLASAIGATNVILTAGANIDASSSSNIALVGSSLATKNNLKVGSNFTIYSTSIEVIGIYDTPNNTFSNSGLIMPLSVVQKLSSQPNQVSSANASIDSIDNLNSATAAIAKQLGSTADVVNSQTQLTNAIAPLQSVSKLSLICLIGAVAVSSLIILLTMIMIVRERRREIGVFKAIGASNFTVMMQFAIESVTFTLIAAIVGIIIGVIGSSPITTLLVNNSASSSTSVGGNFGRRAFGGASVNNLKQIHAAVGWNILLYGLIASLIIALVGSLVSSFLIAKVRPAEVMRVE